ARALRGDLRAYAVYGEPPDRAETGAPRPGAPQLVPGCRRGVPVPAGHGVRDRVGRTRTDAVHEGGQRVGRRGGARRGRRLVAAPFGDLAVAQEVMEGEMPERV